METRRGTWKRVRNGKEREGKENGNAENRSDVEEG